MRTNIKLHIALLVCLCSVSLTATAVANLVDPNFDSGLPGPVLGWADVVSPDFDDGFWGAENSSIVVSSDCSAFAARSSPNMLEMRSIPSQNYTEAWQAVEVVTCRAPSTATLSAWANSCSVGARFYVEIRTFDNSTGWPNHTSIAHQSIDLDSDPSSWEKVSLVADVPTGTEWVLVNVFYLSSSISSNHGYVDDVELALNICDLNSDGFVGLCDEILMSEYYLTNDLRGDFNCDGMVNTTDLAILANELGGGLQLDPASSDATIDIIPGSVSGATVGETVTFQVVANGVPSIKGYAFKIITSSDAYLLGVRHQPGFISYGGGAGDGQCVGGTSGAASGGPSVVLVEFDILYLGADGATIELVGVDNEPGADPLGYPSFIPDNACQWNYFKHSGKAYINLSPPTKVNQYFTITGNSNGTDWPIGIRKKSSKGWIHWSDGGNVLPVGMTASDFVVAFVGWINIYPLIASPTFLGSATMFVNVDNNDEIELGSKRGSGSPYAGEYNWTTLNASVTFNPTLMETGDLTSAMPSRQDFNITNYPNPFNPLTTFSFSLDRDAKVELLVYDLSGRVVRTVIDTQLGAGDYTNVYSWDGRDDQGRTVTSSTYLYRLKIDEGRTQLRKMTLLK